MSGYPPSSRTRDLFFFFLFFVKLVPVSLAG